MGGCGALGNVSAPSSQARSTSGSTRQGSRLVFTGEYRHTIDAKGRLIVPSRLRDQFGENEVVLTIWPEGCISAWAGEGWEKLNEQLQAQRRNNPTTRNVVRQIYTQSHWDKVDKQGRISVPQHLKDFAGVDKEVVIAGVGDHVEIWDPSKYDSNKQQVDQEGLLGLFEVLDI